MDIQSVKIQIIPILKRHHVKRASLFGSIVTGKIHENSDIDILVELPKDHSLMDRAGLKVELEDQLRRTIDVINYTGIKEHTKKSILASQILIYHET